MRWYTEKVSNAWNNIREKVLKACNGIRKKSVECTEQYTGEGYWMCRTVYRRRRLDAQDGIQKKGVDARDSIREKRPERMGRYKTGPPFLK